MEIQMVLHLPRDVASVPVSRQVLDGCLQTLGVTPDTRSDIALAVSEACANVIQHAEADREYQVQVSARNGHCVIKVIDAGRGDGQPAPDGRGTDGVRDGPGTGGGRAGRVAVTGDPVPGTAEHGRGLQIMNAVVDNLQLTGNERHGTTVCFEKTLQWLPGAPGQHLLNAEGAD